VLLLGAAWWIVWTLGNGFCNDFISFNVVRAVSGMGGAMVVPNAVAIVGTTFPPGRMRNRCLGLIGAGAPIGGWTGELIFCLVWSLGGVVGNAFADLIFVRSLDRSRTFRRTC